jgi:hypothetical protein
VSAMATRLKGPAGGGWGGACALASMVLSLCPTADSLPTPVASNPATTPSPNQPPPPPSPPPSRALAATGSSTAPATGAATRNAQLAIASAVSGNLTSSTRRDALAASAASTLTTIAAAVGVPASQVTTTVRTDSVVVSAPPTGRETPEPYVYPGGAIAGIVLGVLGGIGLILVIAYFTGCKRKPQAQQPVVVEEWRAAGPGGEGFGEEGFGGDGSLSGGAPVQAYVLPPAATRYGV